MTIRLMKREDVPQIANLEKICFCDPWSENSIASELENRLSCWLVAEEQGRVIGYVGSQSVLDMADMMNIAVDPDFRRQGIAEQLILALSQNLMEKGIVALLLEVRVSNASAIALYEKLGFAQVGRRPRYYHNPREDALILRKEFTE